MSKKLYFYSIILAVVYIIFVGHSLYDAGQEFASGVKDGYNQAKESHEHGKTRSQIFLCGGDLTPVKGFATFPTPFLNLKTGEEVHLEITQMMAKITRIPDSLPVYIMGLDILRILLSLVLFGLFFYLPFVVYRILKSISKNAFYSIQNINKIRKVSFLLLGIYVTQMAASICLIITTNAYLQIENYKAAFKEFNYSLLFLGLVVLVLSEILRYTRVIKEEQELTI